MCEYLLRGICLSVLLVSTTLVDKQCLRYLGFLSEQWILKILSLKSCPDTLLTRNRKLTLSRLLPIMQKSRKFPFLYFLILKEIFLSDLKCKRWFMKRLRGYKDLLVPFHVSWNGLRIGLSENDWVYSQRTHVIKWWKLKLCNMEAGTKEFTLPIYNLNLALPLVWLSTIWCWLALYLRPLKLLFYFPLKCHDKSKPSLNGKALKFYQDVFANISNSLLMKISYEKISSRPVKLD